MPSVAEDGGERWAFARNVELHSLTDGRWHLVMQRSVKRRAEGDETVQLFDLAADPAEARNLAADRPDVIRRFTRRLAELEEEHRAAERLGQQLEAADGTAVDPEILRQLEALGYLGG
jgi:hypothetical protein